MPGAVGMSAATQDVPGCLVTELTHAHTSHQNQSPHLQPPPDGVPVAPLTLGGADGSFSHIVDGATGFLLQGV